MKDFTWIKTLPQALILVVLIGVILIGAGILTILVFSQKEDKIEILSSEETGVMAIKVDVEGAVARPGIYELAVGSRMEDLLTKAGGLSAEADREWVAKSLNRAQKLTDGAKVYVPKQNERVESREGKSGVAGSNITGKINVNTASASELDKLWGVGPATAQKIIENRPYQTVEELLSKKVLKKNVYERIFDELDVW